MRFSSNVHHNFRMPSSMLTSHHHPLLCMHPRVQNILRQVELWTCTDKSQAISHCRSKVPSKSLQRTVQLVWTTLLPSKIPSLLQHGLNSRLNFPNHHWSEKHVSFMFCEPSLMQLELWMVQLNDGSICMRKPRHRRAPNTYVCCQTGLNLSCFSIEARHFLAFPSRCV